MKQGRIDWRTALAFVPSDPCWRARIGLGGLFMLVFPPVGWVLALGYRTLVGIGLVEGRTPLLPAWRDVFFVAFRRGATASGIILTYLIPFFAAYWLLGVRSAGVLLEHGREIATFAAVVVIFPPLAIPALPVWYPLRYEWLRFSAVDVAVLFALFAGALFVTPAAFLQVALHGRFLAAFNLRSALRLIAARPLPYLEAWGLSLGVSAAAVLTGPLAPWMLFWSYLIISHFFLQVLAGYDTEEVRTRFVFSAGLRRDVEAPRPAALRSSSQSRMSPGR